MCETEAWQALLRGFKGILLAPNAADWYSVRSDGKRRRREKGTSAADVANTKNSGIEYKYPAIPQGDCRSDKSSKNRFLIPSLVY